MDVTTPEHNQEDRRDLDISNVEASTGDFRAPACLRGNREPGFSVMILRSTLNAIHAHGKSDTSVEICGVLVGNVCHDRISPYLLIDAHIPGQKAANKQTQVTFTAETWDEIQKVMEKDYQGKKIVGWYHTHPGFGVFLSGMDLFIQDNFFNLPWQVAWVYDPIAKTDGVFVWKRGKSEKADFLIEEDVAQSEQTEESEEPVSKSSSAGLMAGIIVVFIACFLAAWFGLWWLSMQGFKVRLPIEQ